jgi:prevent-host-death family protein
MMLRVAIEEFQRNFEKFARCARREPVEIARSGQRELVLVSADHYDWLVASSKRASRTADAPATIIGAVARSKMSPKHKKLDALME